jgi:hypothetical protein
VHVDLPGILISWWIDIHGLIEGVRGRYELLPAVVQIDLWDSNTDSKSLL